MAKPSMTSHRASLLEGLIDPRKPGPMAVLIDTGGADYYEQRAIELIGEARLCLQQVTGNPDDAERNKTQYTERMNKVLSLVALAKLDRK